MVALGLVVNRAWLLLAVFAGLVLVVEMASPVAGHVRGVRVLFDGWIGLGSGDAGRVGYNWRYLDGAGHDVTDQVEYAGMVVDRAEAVGVHGGRLLLAVHRVGLVWRVCLPGGEFGDQLDGADFVREYVTPYAAMQVAARRLGLVAVEV